MIDPLGLFTVGCVDEGAYNLTDWLVREMHHQSTQWPVKWGISLLIDAGRFCDTHDGPPYDSVILSLVDSLRTYLPRLWHEHSEKDDLAALAYAGAAVWWAEMVGDGLRWDFKDQIREHFRDDIVLCDHEECGWYEHSMPGNIFYAYVGRAAGFSEFDIRAGAICAQQGDPDNDPALNDWFLGLDQASDQAAIELGFEMYNLTRGASSEAVVRRAFKIALLHHKDRLAPAKVINDGYVHPLSISTGPDGPKFPLSFFDGENVPGWLGQ